MNKVQYNGRIIEFEGEMSVQELLKYEIEIRENTENAVIGAIFNNQYVNLGYKIKEDGEIKLIDISTKEGTKIYRRTLIYILGKAFEKLYPNKGIIVNYQLRNSMFFEIGDIEITEEVIQKLTENMREIVKKDLPIEQVVMNRKQAEEFYNTHSTTKGKLQFDLVDNQEIYMYYCEDYYNYCYGTFVKISKFR